MPLNNRGFDFICGKGFKIDVKASVEEKRCRDSYRWRFSTRYNMVPDYFACIAFDNRTSLNPLHFWLIPGEVANGFCHIGISASTISKWSAYEKSIGKLIKGCNILKGGAPRSALIRENATALTL
jgi:hypothetical protein